MFYDTDSGRIFVDGLLQEYLPIIILLGMAIGLGVILLLAAFFWLSEVQTQKKSLPMNVVLQHSMTRE
jgi:hypothetical protein